MEALCPRTETTSRSRRRRTTTDPQPSSLEAGLFLKNFSEESSPAEIVAAFKQAEQRELQLLKEAR